eukprot:scaffold89939_cov51-Cyclotella_meneghiniana.AAC.1
MTSSAYPKPQLCCRWGLQSVTRYGHLKCIPAKNNAYLSVVMALANKEIKASFAMLSAAERQLCEAGSQQMKEMIMNVDNAMYIIFGLRLQAMIFNANHRIKVYSPSRITS